ncbi:MAG: PAS domain-containing protein [Beijerinckiaceae bacterium]|nr:PAS domain-containing protein [Beijerinckiaceae bacterium]
MKRSATLSLFSYWDDLRSGRGALEALNVAHPGLRKMLAGTFLVEADGRRVYPLRVLGSQLEQIAPNARLGASFLECWDARSRRDLESLLPAVHDDGRPLVLGAISHAADAPALSVEVLLLPLAGGPDGKPRVLGGMASDPMQGRLRTPRRLEITSARTVDARDWRSGGQAPPPRLAPARTPYPALRVVEGGRKDSTQV